MCSVWGAAAALEHGLRQGLLWSELCSDFAENFWDPDGGWSSIDVVPQYSGIAGREANCRFGVFLTLRCMGHLDNPVRHGDCLHPSSVVLLVPRDLLPLDSKYESEGFCDPHELCRVHIVARFDAGHGRA